MPSRCLGRGRARGVSVVGRVGLFVGFGVTGVRSGVDGGCWLLRMSDRVRMGMDGRFRRYRDRWSRYENGD